MSSGASIDSSLNPARHVLGVDLEMDERLEQRQRGMLRQVHDAPAETVPAARSQPPALSGEVGVVRDAPKRTEAQPKMPWSMRWSICSTVRAPVSLARYASGVWPFRSRFGFRSQRWAFASSPKTRLARSAMRARRRALSVSSTVSGSRLACLPRERPLRHHQFEDLRLGIAAGRQRVTAARAARGAGPSAPESPMPPCDVSPV